MEEPSFTESTTSSDKGRENKMSEMVIPAQLKFLMSNIKSVINTQLNPDNYLLWRSQIAKLFTANGFDGFLTGIETKPEKQVRDASGAVILNPKFNLWLLIDQNLAAALYSTISPTLLPYVINLDTCFDIWRTIEKRLQSSNRSKILQLKNELHHI